MDQQLPLKSIKGHKRNREERYMKERQTVGTQRKGETDCCMAMKNTVKKLTHLTKYFFRIEQAHNIDNLKLDKLHLIDYACRNAKIESFADLGGVWGVNGGYTFYGIKKHKIKTAFLVDTDFTKEVLKKSKKHRGLTLINANFGDRNVIPQIGKVDAIFLFDVLLHQVNPDWDEILQMYAASTRCFVIYNQQFIASEKTVRLLDLGYEEFFQNVPRAKDNPLYNEVFEKMYEIHLRHNRIWRDIHNIWQWGIVDEDLFAKMKELGFTLQYYKNCGQFYNLKNFENHAFVFKKNRYAV